MKNSKKGFTLVELLVVIAIVAILSTVAIIGYTSFMKKADLSNDQAFIAQANTTLHILHAIFHTIKPYPSLPLQNRATSS